uniref:Uncharacterized protein n=1 Tax=Anguilla anguilla TaxID=7936 RepID=A0A0E9PI18_ANGAN
MEEVYNTLLSISRQQTNLSELWFFGTVTENVSGSVSPARATLIGCWTVTESSASIRNPKHIRPHTAASSHPILLISNVYKRKSRCFWFHTKTLVTVHRGF